jgi:hypothetical protein
VVRSSDAQATYNQREGKMMRNRRVGRLAYLAFTAVLASLVLGTATRWAYAHLDGVTLNPRGALLFGGTQVLVTGQIQGTRGEEAGVAVLIQQIKGGKAVTAYGVSETIELNGEPQTWQVTAKVGELIGTDPFGSLAPGPATVLVGAASEDPTDADHRDEVTFSARISLHK